MCCANCKFFRWSKGEKAKDLDESVKKEDKRVKEKERERDKIRRHEKGLEEKLKSANPLSDRFQSRGEFRACER